MELIKKTFKVTIHNSVEILINEIDVSVEYYEYNLKHLGECDLCISRSIDRGVKSALEIYFIDELNAMHFDDGKYLSLNYSSLLNEIMQR